MVRNLATMTRVGLLAPLGAATATVTSRLRDGAAIRRARLHPVKVLAALMTYAAGHGQRSSATWTPVPAVSEASCCRAAGCILIVHRKHSVF